MDINAYLDAFATMLNKNIWLAPLLSFFAGVLTSVTPCALTSVALIISFVSGTGQANGKRAFKLSILFAIGSALTFVALGIAASLFGKMLGTNSTWWYLVLGCVLILMALQTWDIYQFTPSLSITPQKNIKGGMGAFFAGVLGGLFSSPCATPVLIVLLSIVAKSGNLFWGGFLLFLYSLGHGALSVAAGTSTGMVIKISQSTKYKKLSNGLKNLVGVFMVVVALYMFYMGF